jgi:hypothetical protein
VTVVGGLAALLLAVWIVWCGLWTVTFAEGYGWSTSISDGPAWSVRLAQRLLASLGYALGAAGAYGLVETLRGLATVI